MRPVRNGLPNLRLRPTERVQLLHMRRTIEPAVSTALRTCTPPLEVGVYVGGHVRSNHSRNDLIPQPANEQNRHVPNLRQDLLARPILMTKPDQEPRGRKRTITHPTDQLTSSRPHASPNPPATQFPSSGARTNTHLGISFLILKNVFSNTNPRISPSS